MSKLTNHERKDKVKWVITAIAFVLAFVMIIGVFMQTFMPEGQRPTDWFEKQPAQEEELPEELPEDDGGAVIAQTSDNGIKLLSAERWFPGKDPDLTTYTLTATVTPANATNKLVDYTAAWANPSSEWASGKNVVDYVKVTQDSSGSLTATVELLNAFSEQVIVSVALRSDSSVNATCTVDYVGTISGDINYELSTYQDGIEFYFSGLKNGTLMPDFEDCIVVTFNIPEHWVTAMQGKGYTISQTVSYTLTLDYDNEYFSIGQLDEILYKAGNITYSSPDREDYWTALGEVILDGTDPADRAGDDILLYEIESKRVYSSVTYDTVSIIGGDNLYLDDWSCFVVPGRNLSLNNTQLVFG